MTTIHVRSASSNYRVICGCNSLACLGNLIDDLREGGEVFVLSSPRVWKCWGRAVERELADVRRDRVILFDDREAAKCLATIERDLPQSRACPRRPQSVARRCGRRRRRRCRWLRGFKLSARRPNCPCAHHGCCPGRQRHRRKDWRRFTGRQEPRRRLLPASIGACRPVGACARCRHVSFARASMK